MPFATRQLIWEELPPLDGEPEVTVEKKEIHEEKNGVDTVKVVEVRTETVRRLKCVEERKKWKLFGLSEEDIEANDGMSESEECVWENPATEKKAEKKPAEFEEVKCRYCGGSHFSHSCPKRVVEPESSSEEPSKPSERAPASSSSPAPSGSGTYSARRVVGRTGSSGESLRQRNDIRVNLTNIPEEATEQDIRDLLGRIEYSQIRLKRKFVGTGNAGAAFIFFTREECAQQAVERLNGRGYGHLILNAEIVKQPPNR